jgi:predicted Zn-dependent protease
MDSSSRATNRADEQSRSDGEADAVAAEGVENDVVVDVGVLVAHSPRGDGTALTGFADQAARDVVGELASATDAGWRFYAEEAEALTGYDARYPSEFLEEAEVRMVEGPYDLVVVLTDVPLLSRRERRVPGLASPLGRVAVVSTHDLRLSPRGRPRRSLDDAAVRWNGAALVLHQLGHVLGAGHDEAADSAMAPFSFDPGRDSVPAFDVDLSADRRCRSGRIPEEQTRSRGTIRRFGFYLRSTANNPWQVLSAVVKSRALVLPLSLPKLSTAALVPTLVVVFSAETWDVGLNITNDTAALFAVGSILLAAVYLLFSHNLLFPRGRQRVLTEHVALVNVAIFCILVLAMVGLYLLIGLIMLTIEYVVFPPNLMTNWPSLEDPTVGVLELVRIAGFIATIGVLSGALGGGLEKQTILRHLVLFNDRP